ncbi:hypothetical protein [uncultured Roseobacter sp.]|uniref:hypothetical protein n=1 Tax=uncultured Roseobacter sp. TaxID=114847 RepID=UPI00262FF3B7|nr:hypothetical protein [uncultured Roseobacter sp.]
MTRPELFTHSQQAVERSASKSRQSLAIHEASREVIEKSISLMDAMRREGRGDKVKAE